MYVCHQTPSPRPLYIIPSCFVAFEDLKSCSCYVSLLVFCVSVLRIDFSVMIFDVSTMNAANSHKLRPFIGLFNSTYVTIYMAKQFHRSCRKSGSRPPLLPCGGILWRKSFEWGGFFSQLLCCTLSVIIDQCSIFIFYNPITFM